MKNLCKTLFNFLKKRYNVKKIFRNIVAVILLLIGVIGGFIPILQGWVFILTGFIVLDFKKKHEVERKIIKIFKRFKLTRGLVVLWEKVKKENIDVIEEEHNEKIRNIYHDIHKEVDKWDKK